MSLKANLSYFLRILLYIHSVDIIFLFVKLSGVASARPAVIYDYFLIAILIAFEVPTIVIWVLFVLIFTLDLLAQISSTFLFNIPELIKNLEFSSLYHLSFIHYISIGFLVGFLILNYIIIRKLNNTRVVSTKNLIFFFSIILLVIYGLDTLNGDSVINRNSKKIIPITKFNIGQSSIKNIVSIIHAFTRETQKPKQINTSVTFNTFGTDSTTSQLLIIVESFGMPQLASNWSKLKNILLKAGTNKGWSTSIGSTPFNGSTTSSELRELLNLRGDYRYLLNKDSANLFKSIFKIKKEQSYQTLGAHSFSVQMFERQVWWRNIGIDSAIFMETIINNSDISSDYLNYDTPFTSLNDEHTFEALKQMIKPDQKVFAYFLTENTHLPFRSKITPKKYKEIVGFENELSKEADNQMRKVQELLFFFINSIDEKEFQKVLIVGDHMPPFTKESDLKFYSKHRVPFIILSKP